MTAEDVIKRIKPLGLATYKNTMMRHGVPEPLFGVKIEELKKIQKAVKKDYALAKELYATGIYDCRYLAGLIADEAKMTKKDLQDWVKTANCGALQEYTVAWVAAESAHGWELAHEWIDSKKEGLAAAGWATLAGIVCLKEDAELDLAELKKLLQRVEKQIHTAPNRVRYVMNGFVIAVGSYVQPLAKLAEDTAKKIGPVEMELVGDCKLPFAPDYIKKAQARGTLGKKKKTVRC